MDRPRKGGRQSHHAPIHLGKLLVQKSGQKHPSENGRWIQAQLFLRRTLTLLAARWVCTERFV